MLNTDSDSDSDSNSDKEQNNTDDCESTMTPDTANQDKYFESKLEEFNKDLDTKRIAISLSKYNYKYLKYYHKFMKLKYPEYPDSQAIKNNIINHHKLD